MYVAVPQEVGMRGIDEEQGNEDQRLITSGKL